MNYTPIQVQVARSILLMAICLLQGCAIGIAKYAGPDIPAKTEITALRSVPIYIRECPNESKPQLGIWTKVNGLSLNDFLSSEYGLTVKQGEPTLGERAVFVQVTPANIEEPMLGIVSGVIHFLSFSLVPGYWTLSSNYTIQVTFTKPDGSAVQHSFESRLSKQEYLWFPFIIKPDIMGSINGGFDNTDAPEKMVQAKKGVAGEIAKEIQKQYELAGGVGGWQSANIASTTICK